MGALMAGASHRGEYEERIKSVLDEVEKAAENGGQGVILFIDELHLIMAGRGSEGGGMDAGNLFKPLLARGKLRCIGATTLAEYRKSLQAYLHEKMNDVAPSLTALLGDRIGARLISHAGSLTNLSKYPASTVQILGAEKALFRALKTKGNTPKVCSFLSCSRSFC